MKKNRLAVLTICICLSVSGCSGSSGADYALSATEYGLALPEGETQISYEVPEARPNVFVDRLGYEPESDKTVIFTGEEMPDTFTIREAESRAAVYTGAVKKKGNDESGEEYNSYGDFSDFQTPGNYYIQVETYGESYPFIIHDNLYYSLFKRACEKLYDMRSGEDGSSDEGWQMQEKGENKEINACLCIYQLLFSYEMFPDVYTDDMGIPESGNEIPDILDECRYEVEWLIHQAQVNPDSSGVASGYRAAVLAKYAYLTKNMDAAFAGECLKAAETAWKSAGKDLSVPDDLVALAAAELYRVSGSRQYLGLAEEYLKNSTEKAGKLSDLEFFGGVTYMNTKSKVDVELCDAMIKKIMEEAENIAETSKQNSFLVYTEKGTADKEMLLREMLRICVVNHVITNHEYNTVIENHFHYLMGRNPDSICHVSYWEGQDLQTEDILENPVLNAAFIFMLSELLSNQ